MSSPARTSKALFLSLSCMPVCIDLRELEDLYAASSDSDGGY